MSTQYIQGKYAGSEASPTEILNDTTGKAIIKYLAKAAGFAYDLYSGAFKYNANGTIRTLVDLSLTQTLTGKTISGPTPSEVVTATNVILAAESGATFFLNSATEFVSTLPAPALGLTFEFVVSAAPSGASYTVVCASAGTLIKGHVLSNDLNAGTDSDFGTSGEGTLTFVDGKSVAGDRAHFVSDGTNWFVRAECTVFDAITIS